MQFIIARNRSCRKGRPEAGSAIGKTEDPRDLIRAWRINISARPVYPATGNQLSLISNKSRAGYIGRPRATPEDKPGKYTAENTIGQVEVEKLGTASGGSSLTEISTLCTNFKGAPGYHPTLSFHLCSSFLRPSPPIPLALRGTTTLFIEKSFGIIYPEPVQFRNTNLQRLRLF